MLRCTKLAVLQMATCSRLMLCEKSAPMKHMSTASKYVLPKASQVKNLPASIYGGRHIVTMIPGQGVGPELCGYVRDIFQVMNVPVDFDMIDEVQTEEDVVHAILSVKRNGVCIKGNIDVSHNIHLFESLHLSSPNTALRKDLDMYTYLNIFKSYKNIVSKHKDVDIIVIRQNTEGEYSMMEHEAVPGRIIESMKIITATGSRRLGMWAFKYALNNNRKKITVVHNANLMKMSDGLFLRTIKQLAISYPEITIDDIILKSCCMELVTNPHQFDILVCPNLYGMVLCNIISGLIGGAGLTSGHNYGDYYAVFETSTRSRATTIADKNLANPVAMLNSAVDLLRYLGLYAFSEVLQDAIKKSIEIDRVTTPDVGGTASSTEVIDKIKANILQSLGTVQEDPGFIF